MGNYLLELKSITKKFPGVLANDNINLNIKEGEIHAIVGENGAGKSTLMNILYGLYEPTSGEIYYKGEKVELNNPLESIDLGIGMVHQHFMLVPSFTVAENIMLGMEPKKNRIIIDEEKGIRETEKLSKEYGLDVDPRAKVETLSVGIQQRVEILKALYKGADIIILDEPTAVLTPQETDDFFKIVRNLVEELGKTIIIITHKLQEVMAISDRVSVMRQGKMIGTVETKDVNENILSEMMVGREVLFDDLDRKDSLLENPVLEVKNLYARNNEGILAVKDISLELRPGEILGVAGIEGNGQSELLETLTGLREKASGSIQINGVNMEEADPLKFRKEGLAHVPEDRLSMGLSASETIMDNLLLGSQNDEPYVNKMGLLNKEVIGKKSRELIETYDIRTPSEEVLINNLSGGNMQKVVIAREFNFDTPILIIAQPTRGVDIGALEFIHSEIMRRRNEGTAILLISAELDEIFRLSDRIITIYEGKITGMFESDKTTRQEVGLCMTGKTMEGGL